MTANSTGGASTSAVPRFRDDLRVGLGIWFITSLMVIGGGAFGWRFVTPRGDAADSPITAFAKWDGGWYRSIVESGYDYTPGKTSNVAFFPAYPLVARAFAKVTACSADLSLFVVAQVFLAASFVVFHAYLRRRFATLDPAFAATALLVFGLFPPTFFFRMSYSEALFFLLVAATLLAVQTRSPLLLLAFVVGLATATRPVGVALLPVVIRETWLRSATWPIFVGRCLVLLPLSLWGLLAYIAYLSSAFDAPLAFVDAQEGWNSHPCVTRTEKWLGLLKLEPFREGYTPGALHWFPTDIAPEVFSIGASGVNALVFLFGLILIAVGVWRRWLTWTEIIIAAGLLGIPYVTRGFESQFLSFARFTAVALPIYVPLALLIWRLPRLAQLGYLLVCVWTIILLTALFCAGYHLV